MIKPTANQTRDPMSAGSGEAPATCALLAILLAMPEDGALDALREIVPQAPWLAEAVSELESLPLDRWQAEHTRLFVSGYPETPCPPFESAYRQGQMGGSMAGDLQRFYRRVGLEPSEAPADYLGTILDCAAYLTDLGQGVEQGREDCPASGLLAEIWEEHLNHWLSRFAHDLQQHAQLSLYRLIGTQLAQLCPVPADGH